jgi:glycosyltransferase involved in cell wall biosynthesis
MKLQQISVVVPCFRCEETLDRALSSVQSQTTPPVETIVVNDGGPCASVGEIVAQRNHCGGSRIRLISLDANRGPSVARNAGWESATQPWVAFLDADDVWHPRKLEVQCGWMTDHPQFELTGHGSSLPDDPPDLKAPIQGMPIGRLGMLLRNPFTTSSVILRRDLPARFDPEMRRSEDYNLWIRLHIMDCKMARITPNLVIRFKRPYGIAGLSADLPAMQQGEIKNLEKLADHHMIGQTELGLLKAWSYSKYAKRRLVHAWHRMQ